MGRVGEQPCEWDGMWGCGRGWPSGALLLGFFGFFGFLRFFVAVVLCFGFFFFSSHFCIGGECPTVEGGLQQSQQEGLIGHSAPQGGLKGEQATSVVLYKGERETKREREREKETERD